MTDERQRRRWPRALSFVLSAAVILLLLNLPSNPGEAPIALVRLPLGAIILLVVFLLGRRHQRKLASAAGVVLAVLALLTVLDLGYGYAFGRRFDPRSDIGLADDGLALLRDSRGVLVAALSVLGVVIAIVALVTILILGCRRIAATVNARPSTSAWVLLVLSVLWVLTAVTGAQVAPGLPLAHNQSGDLVIDHVHDYRQAGLDDERFNAQLQGSDGEAGATGAGTDSGASPNSTGTASGAVERDPLAALRGKDVLIVFIESYGRVAVEDPAIAGPVTEALADAQKRLTAAGYQSETGFLSSPVFGGGSWNAHATLQTGVWVDTQSKYGVLLGSSRRTLLKAFGEQGWRTACIAPGNTEDWPKGKSFYGCDQVRDARTLGYQGPRLGYASIPDQYTLKEVARTDLAPGTGPLAAEIDLISSHLPWREIPQRVPWQSIGDGSGISAADVSGESAKRAYGQAVAYSWFSVTDFAVQLQKRDSVLIVLGDHQPYAKVAGESASHDVPISIITRDAQLQQRFRAWGWTSGVRPAPKAPVWRMDRFRSRFLQAVNG